MTFFDTRIASRLIRSDKGAAAIEFAIIAPLFFAITLSLLEAGWLMTRSLMQDAATTRVVRELRIGSEKNITASSLKTALCEKSLIFKQCEEHTSVEMVVLRSAQDVIPNDRARCTHRGSSPPFNPGQRGDFVFVRVCTTVTPLTPFLGLAVALPDDKFGRFGIVSVAAFVNEPE